MNKIITQQHIEKSISYMQYLQLIEQLLQDNQTTGNNHSPAMIDYTRMNQHRMKRLDKTTVLGQLLVDKLQNVNKPWIWLVLTEAWCGDAAQNLPVLAKMAEQNKNISMRIILRDENPEVMDAYLTEGGRSIPKLICLTPELEEIGTWGPRPEPVQQMIRDFKKEPDGDYKVFTEKVQLWYAKDKTMTMQAEMIPQLDEWISKSN